MPYKKFNALSADLEVMEGDFKMPAVLANESPLARIDVLTDWVNLIENERTKAYGEYFIELTVNPYPDTQFIDAFSAFEKVVAQLDMDPPADLKEICEEAYLEWINKR